MNAPFVSPDVRATSKPEVDNLVVIPCLNEARHIGMLLDQLLAEADELPMQIIVADGGSTDGTQAIVESFSCRDDRVRLIHNPRRIQSAGINEAVRLSGTGAKTLIRIDAHCTYPPDYCRRLVEVAVATGADSVVVGMETRGNSPFQRGVAAAQNSALGAGNSAHRVGAAAGEIDHGHHALMRIEAFRAVGGYDPTFSHNEDAELDHRLVRDGRMIWLTDAVRPVYLPRDTALKLFRQYQNYGRGRARTLMKHRLVPKPRQLIPAGVAPAVGVGLLGAAAVPVVGPVALALPLPALAWIGLSLGYGTLLAVRQRSPAVLWSGPAAIVMHLAWSIGVWRAVLLERIGQTSADGKPSLRLQP